MKVSVILPSFNRAHFITNAINSVLNQDWTGEIELIVVDDNSTDNTRDVVESIADHRLIYIRNPRNEGGAESRNIGIRASTGQYISFIDSDVIWSETKLSTQIPLLASSDALVSFIYCKGRKQAGAKWNIWPSHGYQGHVFQDLLLGNFVDTPSAIVKREWIVNIEGFDRNLPRFQDWDIFLSLSSRSSCIFHDAILYDSYTFPGSITENNNARLSALTLIYQKHETQINSSTLIKSSFIRKFINANLMCGRKLESLKFLKKLDKKERPKFTAIVAIASILPTNLYIYLFNLNLLRLFRR